MAQEKNCLRCGAQIPADAPEGLCLRCLMKVAISEGAEVTMESPRIEGPGMMIGRYKLLELIGEGGMGLVYLAEQQEPIRRRAALKIVKLGMDTKQVIARFEAEKQMLALLDHPNIARVYDAGTTEAGRPYFVMEYVKGQSITEYCDQHKTSIEERLKLFRQVCEGVQHAHQKGIIHRDIKPSNILVTVEGDRAVPKIIDFGIAKAITQSLTGETLFTQQGQLLGTPEYMSPEQVDMATQDIDTRADIYSLGVVLYQLLAGVLPFGRESFEKVGFAEIQRVIQEDEPPKPSARLTGLGEEAKKIAESRKTQVVPLARRLHRELEWVPLKAMRKERVRRYRSASELADDIQNYLNGNPLIAGPETAMYRVKKFVRRHAGSVATAALVAAAIVLGLVVSTAMYLRAEQAHQEETAARTQAEQAGKAAQEQRQRAQRLLARAQLERGVKLLNENNCLGLLDLLDARITADEIPDLRDSAARLWAIAYDLWSDRLVHVLPGAQNLAYSPDGKLLATASGSAAQLWDTVTWQPQGPQLHLEKTISAVVFSPDGKLLVTHSVEGVSQLWDTATWQPVGPILRHKGGTTTSFWSGAQWSAAFNPDGKLLATASLDGTVRLWRTDTGQPYGQPLQHDGEVWTVAFSPDGNLLASGLLYGTAQLWDVASGEPHGPALRHGQFDRDFKDKITLKVAFSPDGKLVAIIDWWGRNVGLWKTDTGQLHKQLSHPSLLDGIFSPDGKLLATASVKYTAQLWNVTTGEAHGERLHHEGRVGVVSFSPDGRLLATGSSDQTVRLWEVASGQPYWQPLRHQGNVDGVVFSPNGKFLVSRSWDGTTRIWRTYQTLKTEVVPRQKGVQLGAISPGGNVGAIVSGEMVQFWDTAAVKALGEPLRHDGVVRTVAFSPDGKLLADGTERWQAHVFEVDTGRCLHTLGCKEQVLAVAFSPDAKVLATGTGDGMVSLWDMATWQELGSPLKHPGRVRAAAYSPDGSILATASGDIETPTVRLWDMSTGPSYLGLELPAAAVRGKAALGSFSTKGTLLVRILPEGKVRLWCLPTVPTNLREMQLRTWVALGAQRNPQGEITAIPSDQWQKLKEELHFYEVQEPEKGDEYYVLLASELERNVAEQILIGRQEELEIKRRVLGEEHPGTLESTNELAWLQATSPRVELRNGAKAIENATKACELTKWKNASYFDTLAAAYAEAGDFASAVKWQKEAINLLTEKEPADWQADFEERLKLYQSGKTYRESP